MIVAQTRSASTITVRSKANQRDAGSSTAASLELKSCKSAAYPEHRTVQDETPEPVDCGDRNLGRKGRSSQRFRFTRPVPVFQERVAIGGRRHVPGSAPAAHQRQSVQVPAGAEEGDHVAGVEPRTVAAGPARRQQQGAEPEQVTDRSESACAHGARMAGPALRV